MVAASRAVKSGNDLWIGLKGGYMLPRDGPIATGLRREFERLAKIYGMGSTVQLYEENGVYNFYLDVDDEKRAGAALAPLEEGLAANRGQA